MDDFLEVPVAGLHDRMIITTYLQEGADAILTNDPEMSNVAKTVWK